MTTRFSRGSALTFMAAVPAALSQEAGSFQNRYADCSGGKESGSDRLKSSQTLLPRIYWLVESSLGEVSCVCSS